MKIVSSNPPTTYNDPAHLTSWIWVAQPLPHWLLIYHSTPSIYLSYLTLYKGQSFARNIYTRIMALTIILWLYNFLLINFWALLF